MAPGGVIMIRLTGALVLVVLTSVLPLAQSDITGTWELTINGPQGAVTADATFKQTGEKISGTLTSPQGEVEVAGTMSGNALKIQFNVPTEQGPLDIVMTADVDGDSMKGMIDFSMGTADFTGKKK
jgi:hypothetical protein